MSIKLCVVLCGMSFAFTASATELFVNGNFETGDLSGWTITNDSNATADLGSFYIADNTCFGTPGPACTPQTGAASAGPADGQFYAVSDDFGPGIMALSQSFMIPLGSVSALLSFDVFVNDFVGNSGGIGRVDLLAGNADPITGTPIATFYGPADTPVVSGIPNAWVPISLNIFSLITPGQTYQIRVLDDESNGGPINVGADAFSLDALIATPEPSMFLPVGLAAGFFFFRSRRRAQ
jgi:hypothetical protein